MRLPTARPCLAPASASTVNSCQPPEKCHVVPERVIQSGSGPAADGLRPSRASGLPVCKPGSTLRTSISGSTVPPVPNLTTVFQAQLFNSTIAFNPRSIPRFGQATVFS